MICRKCGKIIPDNSIRCSNCGIKVNMICPECKTIVPFGEKYCINCGFELIKTCPSCHSANIYSAEQCRKCNTPFSNSQTQNLSPETEIHKEEISNQVSHFAADSSSPSECSVNNDTEEEKNAEKIETAVKKENILSESDEFSPEIVEPITATIQPEQDSMTETLPKEPEEELQETEEEEKKSEQKIPEVDDSFTDEVSENTDTINGQEDLVAGTFTNFKELEDTQPDENTESIEETENVEEENIQNIQDDELQEQPQDEPREEAQEEDNIEQEPKYIIQQNTTEKIVQYIKNSIEKHIIAVNGPEGCGKTAVINQVRNILTDEGFLCLCGNCTPLSQITSFGFFQDVFLRMLGLPPYINSSEAFLRDFKKSELNNVFNFLQPNELGLFLNLLYPAQRDSFENILENKQLMFSIIEKVIKTFLTNSNIVIIIDNFDLLDGASYDFITYMASKKFFNNRLKLLAAYQESKPIQNYFDLTVKDNSIFTTININKPDSQELIDMINSSTSINLSDVIPDEYLLGIINRSENNAIKLEQNIAYLFDINYLNIEDEKITINEEKRPEKTIETMEELIKLRLNLLPAEIKNILYMASIMGYRFATNILCNAVPTPGKKAINLLEVLRQQLFIVPVDDFTCEFKNLTIWKHIYKEAKADPLFKDNSERLYSILKSRVLSSNIQKIISCAEALSKEEEFIIWQDTAYITSKLGDTNLYVIAQKQCLKILEEKDMPNAENVREIIYEQIGKLLSKKSPNEAVSYLANVLDSRIKASDINKIIDISGYFINSCYLTGNYFGVKEAVDAILTALSSTESKISDTDLALIKTRKLVALLNIGNTEEVINLINDEILVELNKEIAIKQPDISYKNILIDAWFLSNIVLAKAYLIQGKQNIFSITAAIKEYMNNNNIKSEYYSAQVNIIEAFAHSTRGEINLSNELLNSISDYFKKIPMDKKLLCEMNLINIINKIFSNQMQGLKEDLFELAAFANNINEHFIKNIIKLILGHIIKEEGNTTKALSIYNEQITYFAKEKIAIGALLSWALIVRISIDMGDMELALNTAIKALEIAEGPKIKNFFFIIYFQKYIAEIYRAKGDFTAVKMYLEKALMVAKQNNLKYQLVNLYIDYGKYMECFMKTNQVYNDEYVKLTLDMYNKAAAIAGELKIPYLIEKTARERINYKRYCQLNSIEV